MRSAILVFQPAGPPDPPRRKRGSEDGCNPERTACPSCAWARDLPRGDAQRWLVEQLWGASSVGLIGGAPKCSKTWLGLDLALSVATGTACLGKYAVPRPGPVLVYLAEDALPMVRQRVEGMARHRGLELQQVEIHVITAPTLRLDRQPHRRQLLQTAQRLAAPAAAVGSAGPPARHRRKQRRRSGRTVGLLPQPAAATGPVGDPGASHAEERRGGVAAGQGLRGSSDLHAFGDSNLYLKRTKDRLLLSSEHRAAPASPPVYLELVATDAQTTHLISTGFAATSPWRKSLNCSASAFPADRRSMVRSLSLARPHVRPCPPLLRERGQASLLLPQVPQPRQPVGTLGRVHPDATAPRHDRSLPRTRTRHPVDPTLATGSRFGLRPQSTAYGGIAHPFFTAFKKNPDSTSLRSLTPNAFWMMIMIIIFTGSGFGGREKGGVP
jgi:hypothetical protein